jgi:hypothetical protein
MSGSGWLFASEKSVTFFSENQQAYGKLMNGCLVSGFS